MRRHRKEEPANGRQPKRWLTRGVRSIGLASFFSDSGHEITTSLLPSFVTVTLRSTAGALGVKLEIAPHGRALARGVDATATRP